MQVVGSNGTVGGHPADNFTVGAWIQETVSATVPTWLQGPYTVTLWAEVDSTSGTQSTAARFDDATLNGNTIFFAEDSLGTTRVVTDSSGVVCYDADFYPYGGERPYTNTCTTHYKFEGKERDTETGNDDFGARYYSNRFGRWLSSDWSSVPVAVPYANLTNPQTLNLYSMVSDDPESFADLDGHCERGWDCLTQSFRTTAVAVGHAYKTAAVTIGSAYKAAGEAVANLVKDTANQAGTGVGQVVAGVASNNDAKINSGLGNITLAVVPFVTDGVGEAAAGETLSEGTIFRAGGTNPGNLTIREGEGALSFRDSLSDPIGAGTSPVFTKDDYIAVEVSKLPKGSAVLDNNPPGHVSVRATAEEIKKAATKGKLPKPPRPIPDTCAQNSDIC